MGERPDTAVIWDRRIGEGELAFGRSRPSGGRASGATRTAPRGTHWDLCSAPREATSRLDLVINL
jgi:hypothetical protein